MTGSPFEAAGRFFRGNIHLHSNRSDGALPPEEVCRRYAEEGYDFVSLTDHFVGLYGYPITDTIGFRTENFTTILGAELHSGANDAGEIWHILAVGLPHDFAPSQSPDFRPLDEQETGPEIAKRAVEAGAFVAIAHPHWSALTENDARSIKAAHAVEVYNHGCDVECDRGYGLETLDKLLNEGRKLTLCATDDAHFETPDYFGGWTMVKAVSNTPDALLAALKAGHHYSSQGPDFHDIVWNAESVTVSCSSVSTVVVQGSGSATSQSVGTDLTSVTLPLRRVANSPWARVSIIDQNGKRAWSNPVWKNAVGRFEWRRLED